MVADIDPTYMHSVTRLALALFVAAACVADAEVVRLAPELTFPGPANKTQTLKSLRGQPVVLLIASSPDNKAFRKQLAYFRDGYQQFAARKTIFIAAFQKDSPQAVKSNIPFVIAGDGNAVAAAYQAKEFSLVIIGVDGNIDYQTDKPRPAWRIHDVTQNSYEVQAGSRKSATGP